VPPKPPSTPTTVAQNNRLPPEMLAAIFFHLSKRKIPLTGRISSHLIRDLVSVTHVCRFWRQAAINAPEVWTDIPINSAEVARVFLERSGELPLNVYLRLYFKHAGKTNHDIIDAVNPRTHRLQQLSVHVQWGLDSETSIPFTKPAPLLERLVIFHLLGDGEILLFDDKAPRLRELVMVSKGLWLQNQLGNLTSLHLTLSRCERIHLGFLPFFDMLHRCPVLEEMFLLWGDWDAQLIPPQTPNVPLHRLRKLLLCSFHPNTLRYFLHSFDLKSDGIAIHLNRVVTPEEDDSISGIQAIFPKDRSDRPSFVSSTKLELIFNSRPRVITTIHAVGPGFSIRMDLCLSDPLLDRPVKCVFRDGFPLVGELWVRGASLYTKLDGIKHFTALEKLVLIGRGSKMAQKFRQALSPSPSGVLPCPLLSTIDFHGDSPEMPEIFLLVRNRSSAGRRLEKLRVPTSFIPLPAHIASCVRDVGSFDIPSRMLDKYAMELPEFCFVNGKHGWWHHWGSKVN